jgi:hypothetical protein
VKAIKNRVKHSTKPATNLRPFMADIIGKYPKSATQSVGANKKPNAYKKHMQPEIVNTKSLNQAAIIALFRVINRYVGNLPPMPGMCPNCTIR